MMKRTIPMLLAMAAGIVMILAYFFPPLTPLQDKTTVWFNILAAVAFILGGGNLLKVHLKKVSDRREGLGVLDDHVGGLRRGVGHRVVQNWRQSTG